MDQIKFVKTALKKITFQFLKAILPQILCGPFLEYFFQFMA